MTITIRHEEEKDYRIVEEITREAFWNLYFPGAVEHLLVHNIRKHPDYIPELSYVIELDNQIIGSIFYTKAKVIDKEGVAHPIITFGPVSISPAYHRQGFGRMLIEHSLAEAKRLGFNAIILGGFTYHYHPYGFVGTKKYNISMPDGKFYTGVMALPLFEGALDGISGSVHFSEAMYPDESLLDDFDQTFPPKEKQVLPHQADFEKAVSEIDNHDY
ncbi:GNAT family N-acetyltransferase [Latilactobacillus curvatus]|uniref:GNAT family N-acetyltransferase n=1 Tax=Latilactobacillus curvatus TaxID=28038 RepID=A0AAC9UPS7_LATCU|nr:N-acetyltransferase [Latilactobacillus curvatus]ASN60019.1 GNAT family N-acetyltransferase [Latilactobacillus curvatus]QAR35440.1 N-acetyltransferase [Latilactobacillus curvatus]